MGLLPCKILYTITILTVLLHWVWHRVQDSPFWEFWGRTVHTATHIPSRIRTLDLNEKPEGTLDKDQLKQMTSRSKSMCSMPLETQLDFWEVWETGKQMVLLKTLPSKEHKQFYKMCQFSSSLCVRNRNI